MGGRAEQKRSDCSSDEWTISEWVSVEPTVAVDFSALLRRGPRSGFSRRIAAYYTNATHDPTDRAPSPSAPPSVRLTTDETSQLVARPLISGTRSTADLSVAPRPPARRSERLLASPLPPIPLSLLPCPSASRREVGFIAPRVARSLAPLGRFEFETMRDFSAPLEFCIFGHRGTRPARHCTGGKREGRERGRGHLDRFFRPSDFGWSSARAPRRRYCRPFVRSVVRRPVEARRVCASRSPQAMPCLTCLVTRLSAQMDASSYFRCSPARAVIL